MTEVVVVGASSAGNNLAAELRRSHAVTVLDRKTGSQVVSVQAAAEGLFQVNTIGVHGPSSINARAVVLATGSRERSQAARLIAGSPVSGVLTGSELEASESRLGRNAVILGGDHHAYRALRHLRGMSVVALVTPWSKSQVGSLTRMRFRSKVRTSAYIERIVGDQRVTAVDIVYRDGRRERIECDTVVLTGDFIPEYELALRSGVVMDRATTGPAVDGAGRTSRAGIFAIGNLIHPGFSGEAVNIPQTAAAVRDYVDMNRWPSAHAIDVASPIDWISPALGTAAQYVLSASVFRDNAVIRVSNNGIESNRVEVRNVLPGVPFVVNGGWSNAPGTLVELI